MKDQAGEILTYVASSWGARRALKQLYGRFDRERKEHGLWPVVKLETEHRHHKQYGSIPEPRFSMVGWHGWEWETKPKGGPKPLEVTADDPRTQVAEVANGGSYSKVLDDEIPFAPEWRA
jgi:hypothetical protein